MSMSNGVASLSEVDGRILCALLEQAGRVTSRESLMRLAAVESHTSRRVDIAIVALRRVLGPESITTVRQRGWMLTTAGIREAELLRRREVNIMP